MTPSDKPDTDDLDMWEIDCGIPSAKGDASVASKEIKVKSKYILEISCQQDSQTYRQTDR